MDKRSRRSRKYYSPEEKVAILKRHLVERVPVSDLCDQYGLHVTMLHRWQKALFEHGAAAFDQQKDRGKNTSQRRIATLEEKLNRKNEVVAELMEEHIKLKKTLGAL